MDPATTTKLIWWAYKHVSGSLLLKRYFMPLNIIEAKQSPFVEEIMMPFEAESRIEASKKVNEYFKVSEDETKKLD